LVVNIAVRILKPENFQCKAFEFARADTEEFFAQQIVDRFLWFHNKAYFCASGTKIRPMHSTAKLRLFVLMLPALLWTSSCRKFEEFPPEPEIAFADFKVVLTSTGGFTGKGRLYISYRDGDGDIGLEQGDTLAPFNPGGDFYYNLIIRFSERRNGQMVELPGLNFSARIPPLIPKNQKRSIKGIIEYELDVYNPNSSYDTIQYHIRLADRALNLSNEVASPLIIRPKP
jgi:hypothetical protein